MKMRIFGSSGTITLSDAGNVDIEDMYALAKEHLKDFPERVSVLYSAGHLDIEDHASNGVPCEMFVDESGSLKCLEINEEATIIYWANMFKRDRAKLSKAVKQGAMNFIHGDAIIFSEE